MRGGSKKNCSNTAQKQKIEIEGMRQKIEKLQNSLVNEQKKNKGLTEHYKDKKLELAKQKKEIAELNTELEKKNTELKQQNTELKQKNDAIMKLEEQDAKQKQQNTELKKKNQKLMGEADKLLQKARGKNRQLDSEKKRLGIEATQLKYLLATSCFIMGCAALYLNRNNIHTFATVSVANNVKGIYNECGTFLQPMFDKMMQYLTSCTADYISR